MKRRSPLIPHKYQQIVFGSDCDVSVRPLPFSGHFQTPLQPQSAYFPQIRRGWDGTGPHVCRVPGTRLRGYQTRIEPAETDSDSFSRQGNLAGASDKTGTRRLVCSTCAPHGAHRASDCRQNTFLWYARRAEGIVPSPGCSAFQFLSR